jgi:PAS domain S-box-containing protein
MDQLRRHDDIFDTVFMNAEIGLAVLDAEGVILRANPGFGGFLMRAEGSLGGRQFTNCMLGKDRQPAKELIARIASGERPSDRAESRFLRGDGHTAYGMVTYARLSDSAGAADAIVAIVDDITAQKEAIDAEREREQAVRRAYADVVSAVTGGRLLILPHEEVPDQLGELVLGPLGFHSESDPGEIRHAVRAFAATEPDGVTWDDGFEVAIGEALLNALKHSGGGELSLHLSGGVLQAVITDSGPGIDFATIARSTFESGFTTTHTLGVGFTLILSFTSRILLATGAEGTTIVLEGHDGGPDRTLPG